MSAYHEIHLRPLGDNDPVADLERVLGVGFRRDVVAGFVAGVKLGNDVIVEVSKDMGFSDDAGMPFETHPWFIVIRSLEQDKATELEVAEKIFDGLKASGRHSLFLTFDSQRLLDSAIVG